VDVTIVLDEYPPEQSKSVHVAPSVTLLQFSILTTPSLELTKLQPMAAGNEFHNEWLASRAGLLYSCVRICAFCLIS
jgi:hypothetical protein